MTLDRKHKHLLGWGSAVAAVIIAGATFGTASGVFAAAGTEIRSYLSNAGHPRSATASAAPIPSAITNAQDTKNLLDEKAAPATESAASVPQAQTQQSAESQGTAAPKADPTYCKKYKCIALTFDDGPGPYTKKLLSDLHKGGAKATFFIVGKQLGKFPHIANLEVESGNQVCGHSWSHKDLNELSTKALKKDTAKTNAAITKATGQTITCIRPPYGALTTKKAKLLGQRIILWDVDTLDWKTRNTKKTIKAATKHAKRGQIILMHDIHKSTVKGVPKIIAALKKKGFKLVTVDTLLAPEHPSTGKKYFGAN